MRDLGDVRILRAAVPASRVGPDAAERYTQGEDLDEARSMVKDAIALVLEERRTRGEPIPQTGWALVEPVDVAA